MNTEMKKLILEQAVFTLASRFIEGYAGGLWGFDKDAFVWFPKGNEKHTISNCNNYFEGVLDSLTVGFALSGMAANHLSWMAHDSGKMNEAREWDDLWRNIMQNADQKLNQEQMGLLFAFLD